MPGAKKAGVKKGMRAMRGGGGVGKIKMRKGGMAKKAMAKKKKKKKKKTSRR